MSILRMNIPISPHGRTQCCVYGVKDTTGAGRDLVCGKPTTKFLDREHGCYDWKPFCAVHQTIVDAEPVEDEG